MELFVCYLTFTFNFSIRSRMNRIIPGTRNTNPNTGINHEMMGVAPQRIFRFLK